MFFSDRSKKQSDLPLSLLSATFESGGSSSTFRITRARSQYPHEVNLESSLWCTRINSNKTDRVLKDGAPVNPGTSPEGCRATRINAQSEHVEVRMMFREVSPKKYHQFQGHPNLANCKGRRAAVIIVTLLR